MMNDPWSLPSLSKFRPTDIRRTMIFISSISLMFCFQMKTHSTVNIFLRFHCYLPIIIWTFWLLSQFVISHVFSVSLQKTQIIIIYPQTQTSSKILTPPSQSHPHPSIHYFEVAEYSQNFQLIIITWTSSKKSKTIPTINAIAWDKDHSVECLRGDQMKVIKSPLKKSNKEWLARMPISDHLLKRKSTSWKN